MGVGDDCDDADRGMRWEDCQRNSPIAVKAQRDRGGQRVAPDGLQQSGQQLYIAYFGRPADPGGLHGIEDLLSSWGVPPDLPGLLASYNADTRVKSLIDSFGVSDESKALYTGTTSDFVTSIYLNLFNREPDRDGLPFWAGAIDSGNLTRSGAAINIMAVARSTDIATIAGKTVVATSFTTLITGFRPSDRCRADSWRL